MYRKSLEEVKTCTLCDVAVTNFSIIDSGLYFCCNGCQIVYSILSSKQQLDHFQESPIFKQAVQAGLISNPALLDQIRERSLKLEGETKEKLHLEIGEMWCPSCSEVIRLVLLQQRGVAKCIVDYATDLATIEYSPKHISEEKIRHVIKSLGYIPMNLETPFKKKVDLNLYIRFGVAAFCALNAMMFSYPLYATYFDPEAIHDGKIFAWLGFICSLPVMTYCMWPIWKRFTSALWVGLLGMEALVVVGVSAAFAISLYELMFGTYQVYFDSMTVIIAFVLLGKIIEAKAKFSARESLFRLTKSIPRRGRKLFPDGASRFVSIKDIQIGDRLVAHAGEKIVLDGEVCQGEGLVDESLMTGEFLPIEKKFGSKLLAGTLLKQGSIHYKVFNRIEESALQRIIQTVEEDLKYKTPYVRPIDKIINWFVPAIFVIAFLTWAFAEYFGLDSPVLRAISVLLIACPCAIGIAAPLAESQLMYQLTLLGIIVRNRGCLAVLPKITTFIFDKTGTITEGSFSVIEGLATMPEIHKEILKALSERTNHLMAKAIYNSIEENSSIALENITEFQGKGMIARRDDHFCILGSKQFFSEQNILLKLDEGVEHKKIMSIVYFSPDSGNTTYRLVLGDNLRSEGPDVIQSLNGKTVLLSGDSKEVVKNVAEACGFGEFFYEFNPLQKRDYVDSLRTKNEFVCMVGDGINDAPALTVAHVGISVLSATDISVQVSDLFLTTDRLDVIPKAIKLSSITQKIIKQNFFWAFFYNLVGIGLAIGGLLSPIFAAFAMTISSLIVLFNSKRINS